jgi:uncharacterized protein DUF6265
MRTKVSKWPVAILMMIGFHGAAAATCLAQSPPPNLKVSLADLEFISGHWSGEMGGGTTDEHWSAPAGDNMMGVFRYIKNGKAVFYEMLLIEMTATGPVLRLKHFNPGLIGWEEKNEAYNYPMIEFAKNKAVFERPDKQSRMTFHLTATDSMVVVLEQMKDGKMSAQEFKYQRAK